MSGVTYGSFTPETYDELRSQIQQETGILVRTFYWADYANGLDTNLGTSRTDALKTLSAAYAKCEAGKNDAVVVVSTGASAGFQRLSAAFTWSKAATHLIGVSNGISSSPRASIRPTSGVTAFTPLFTLSASGCLIQDIGFWSGFTTGTTAQLGVVVTGSYNRFVRAHIVGMADAESAADAGSRSIKIGGSGAGENEFINCTFGVDTVTRSAANASVELVGATPRNKFVDCTFRFMTSAATPLGIIGSAAGCIDRDTTFIRCTFINAIKSTSTVMDGLSTLPASAGGMLVLKDCTLVGITEFGTDATTRGQIYVDGAAPTAATSGVAVNPT